MDDTLRPQARDDLAEGSAMFSALVRRLTRVSRLSLFVAVGLLMAAGVASAGGSHGHGDFEPGADGAGDPYFPLDGNGGYDVKHYFLDVAYDPDTDVLDGVATIEARATQNLSSFNLDLVGLTVESIKVDGRRATWSRDGQELTVTPKDGIRKNRKFKTVVRYSGIPESLEGAGFIPTDDGALVIGEPHVAASWFPVNDHPSDKASYSFEITVPAGLEAVANGVLDGKRTKHGRTTWSWEAKEPMASYLATASMGEFEIRAYKENGIRFWDAVDPDLYTPFEPRTGSQFAISQKSEPSYKRLQRTIAVPSGGAALTFWVNRNTEGNWDFFFVEAHTAGMDDWTTLPDANGHTSQDTGFVCPFSLELHPFLEHYQTPNDEGGCDPDGHDRRLERRQRHERRLGAVEHRPLRVRGLHGRGVALVRERRPLPDAGRLRRRHRRLHRSRDDLVRERRRHDGRLDRARRAARERPEPERLDRRHGGGRAAAGRRAGGRGLRAPAARSSSSRRATSATTRSRPAAASSTTSPGSGSRSRTRPGRSTRWTSSSTSSRPRTSSSTSSRTSGTATASPSRSGSTSG